MFFIYQEKIMMMINLCLILPIGAFIIAVIGSILVVYAFRHQPIRVKRWLLSGIILWMPWSFFTILMRYADTEEQALFYLRLSFISLEPDPPFAVSKTICSD